MNSQARSIDPSLEVTRDTRWALRRVPGLDHEITLSFAKNVLEFSQVDCQRAICSDAGLIEPYTAKTRKIETHTMKLAIQISDQKIAR
jgi:hypothetical protein